MIKDCLLKFAGGKLFEACSSFLEELHISFDRETEEPVHVADYYGSAVPKYLQDVIDKTEAAYFIGVVTDLPDFADNGLSASADSLQGKYSGLFFFAVDIDPNQKITRSELASLTRGFNRISKANPVVLFIRQGSLLTLSTCERTEYKQLWREGEKLGTVSMLRDINCLKPHHGHLEILKALGDKSYPTFDELYQHWMYVFSSKLLTERFYSELSDWYAWAVSVVRFPNDIKGTADDGKLNSEAVICMITRLIFVWFLYCKRLIPKEFFDEKYIYDHFLDNFTPDGSAPLLYNPEESRYYRAILQNLFFAMLNRPIVAEGKDTTDNRRFMSKKTWHGMNPDYNVNNLMRYEDDFKEGGAAEFLRLANSTVPFLNGGLFDCLDQKPDIYYDGFSEREESLKRLRVPDYLFFGGTADANLYDWYHDNKKKHVRVRGLIDLFKSYYFTVEENTPLDQEVSLDPELLGKAFENLLAAYVPETGTNARKMTGSFYTPREIVQHMVDACLVAHLKRMCGDSNEQLYRSLLSYSDDDVPVDQEMRRKIMNALYNCRVLDPACGSGAFPMGMLQQMVHVLRRIDPENTMWRELMVSRATQEAEQAFGNEDESERNSRLDDIESAFNSSVNDPDYARKLYLIEHCIYGVDIQAVAIQICKLRFFISLVVDQRPTDDASSNFGIRPLPNLEAKFVAANTLIPVDYDGTLVDQIPEVRKYKEELKELNHKIFLSRRNADKKRLKARIAETRNALSKVIADSGFVQPGVATKLAAWDMFDQNKSSDFFDPEWMFGVKGGFDIVIGNPPYGATYSLEQKTFFKAHYLTAQTKRNVQKGSLDTFTLFIERGYGFLCKGGAFAYIVPMSITSSESMTGVHRLLINNCEPIYVSSYAVRPKPVFINAVVDTSIIVAIKTNTKCQHLMSTKMYRIDEGEFSLSNLLRNQQFINVIDYTMYGRIPKISLPIELAILNRLRENGTPIYKYMVGSGFPIIYRFAGGRYFKVVTNYSNGSSAERAIYFSDEKTADAIGCILSSSLSFWFYQIYSDNHNWKNYEIENFRIPELTDNQKTYLSELYAKYLQDIENKANIRQSTGMSSYNVSSFKEYKIVRSKSIIDEIDDYIGPLYGLSDEEIDFIKNYEIYFRMKGE